MLSWAGEKDNSWDTLTWEIWKRPTVDSFNQIRFLQDQLQLEIGDVVHLAEICTLKHSNKCKPRSVCFINKHLSCFRLAAVEAGRDVLYFTFQKKFLEKDMQWFLDEAYKLDATVGKLIKCFIHSNILYWLYPQGNCIKYIWKTCQLHHFQLKEQKLFDILIQTLQKKKNIITEWFKVGKQLSFVCCSIQLKFKMYILEKLSIMLRA